MGTGTALVIVDVQTGLVAGANPVYRLDALLENISTFITQARSTGTLIIYIQDNDVDEIGSPGWQIHPTIAPEAGDLVIHKLSLSGASEKRFTTPQDRSWCLEGELWSREAVAKVFQAEKHEWMPGKGPVDPDRSRDPHAGNTARSSWARSPCIAR